MGSQSHIGVEGDGRRLGGRLKVDGFHVSPLSARLPAARVCKLVPAQMPEVALAVVRLRRMRAFVAEGPDALVDAQRGAAGRVLDEGLIAIAWRRPGGRWPRGTGRSGRWRCGRWKRLRVYPGRI